MIAEVARRLGPILDEVVLVGGCSTGLLLTDELFLGDIRHTEDVDLIVHVVGMVQWYNLQTRLRKQGFTDDMDDGSPMCAMKCGEIRVDFMPDDETVLGFSNRWYAAALASASPMDVDGFVVRLVSPACFVATKLEAYAGRGNGDPMTSRDVEDLLTLFGGRREIIGEIGSAEEAMRAYMVHGLSALLDENGFDYAVQDVVRGDPVKQEIIMHRLRRVIVGERDE